MRLGVPKEIKTHEYRVGMTPTSVREAVHRGHEVLVESAAGAAIGLGDERYRAAGARIVDSAEEVFAAAELIVKVKEPQPAEYPLIRAGQVLFTYLHLAPDPLQTAALLERGCIAIAYETVTDSRGRLPLLAPMSDVAGRMSIQVGAHCLELEQGGRGVLLGGMPGVPPAKVVVLGGGNVSANAARMAVGLGAHVTVLDISMPRLYELEAVFGPAVYTVHATLDAIEAEVTGADLVIGAVLVARRRGAPHRHPRHGRSDEAGLGRRRRGDRPERLFRDLTPDQLRRAHLPGGRRGALLRHQHARRRGPHLDVCAQQPASRRLPP